MLLRTAAVVVSSFLVTACGNEADAAMKEAQRMAGEAAAAAQQMAGASSLFGDLGKVLGGITDGASAAKAKEQLTTLVARLQTQLGANGDLSRLQQQFGSAATAAWRQAIDQATKLAGNPEVKQAIGPVLDQMKALLGGK